MTDANSSVTVDGVEPSIHVRYVENAALGDKNSKINLFQADDGTPRSVALGDDVWVTPSEYATMTKSFSLEVITDEQPQTVNTETVSEPTVEPSAQQTQSFKPLETPGQTG